MIVTIEQIRRRLREVVDAHGSIPKLAEHLKCSRQFVNKVLQSKTKAPEWPQGKLLRLLHLQRVTVYAIDDTDEAQRFWAGYNAIPDGIVAIEKRSPRPLPQRAPSIAARDAEVRQFLDAL